MKVEKIKKIFLLMGYVLIACAFMLWLELDYFFTLLIILIPPTVVNFIWLKDSRFKITIFSIVTVLLFAPPVEISARLADVWNVQTIFPEFLGLVSVENMIFAFINFFWILVFYEYFVDGDRGKIISKRFKYIVTLFCLFSILIYSLYAYNQEIVTLSYFQIAFIILIVPAVAIFSKKPKLLKKTILPTLFFALVFFVYELVALKIGNWWWPGDYWLTFTVWGEIFPVDDIIIWYFLSTPVLIGGYEFFVDDWK
jgi:hypothetical protein